MALSTAISFAIELDFGVLVAASQAPGREHCRSGELYPVLLRPLVLELLLDEIDILVVVCSNRDLFLADAPPQSHLLSI